MSVHNKRWYRALFRRRMIIATLLILQTIFLAYIIFDFSKYSTYVSWAFTLMSIGVALHIVSSSGTGANKLSWVFLTLLFPLFGGMFYLFVKSQRSTKRFTKKLTEIGEQSKELFDLPGTYNKTAMQDLPQYKSQIKYLQSQGFPVYKNTVTKYLTPGEVKFVTLLEELEKAEKYIFLEYFIIEEGYMWDSILAILKRKVNQGVDVRILYDDMGCFLLLPSNYAKKLNELGIKCIVFNTFKPFLTALQNNRDHRKIAVIDGKVAFTGGINLADEYINKIKKYGHWKDSSIMLKGEAAWGFTLIFLQMWEICNRKSEKYLDYYPYKYEKCKKMSEEYVIPYADSPLDNENVGENVYMQIIAKATDYLYINTPYLIIDDGLLTALKLAANSGVDVRIVTPHLWDKIYVHFTTRSYYRELILAGVKVYEYKKGFIHSKVFVSDDKVATVGTINMDFRSLYLHFECGVCLYNSPTIYDIKNDFVKTLDDCIQITEKDCKGNRFTRFLQSIFRLFAPLM